MFLITLQLTFLGSNTVFRALVHFKVLEKKKYPPKVCNSPEFYSPYDTVTRRITDKVFGTDEGFYHWSTVYQFEKLNGSGKWVK